MDVHVHVIWMCVLAVFINLVANIRIDGPTILGRIIRLSIYLWKWRKWTMNLDFWYPHRFCWLWQRAFHSILLPRRSSCLALHRAAIDVQHTRIFLHFFQNKNKKLLVNRFLKQIKFIVGRSTPLVVSWPYL